MGFFDFLQADKTPPTQAVGASGLDIQAGYVYDELLLKLKNPEYRRRDFREMADNDPTIGGMLYSIETMIRGVEWVIQPCEDDFEDMQGHAAWLHNALFSEMDTGFADHINEALSMLVYGFSVFEVVYKKLPDGKLGISTLNERVQETLLQWYIKDDVITGVKQQIFGGDNSRIVDIPSTRLLHYRTTTKRNNPEGRSILRACYAPYLRKKYAEQNEIIGIQRDLSGIPQMTLPMEYLAADASADKKTYVEAIKRILATIQKNEQSGIIVPSDTYEDNTGKPTNVRKFEFSLVASAGTRANNTTEIINRYDEAILRSCIAEFQKLGSQGSGGSYSLGDVKLGLFYKSLQCYIDNIAATFNNQLIKKLWLLNGWDIAYMPKLKGVGLQDVDVTELSEAVKNFTLAGVLDLTNNPAVSDFVADKLGLPHSDSNSMDGN
ncbi:MAG: hypothetical protein EBR82_10060 [Caulobacteraceae bacterium]|nr:hypothetical protein [Caulobacteraceae bacterium]